MHCEAVVTRKRCCKTRKSCRRGNYKFPILFNLYCWYRVDWMRHGEEKPRILFPNTLRNRYCDQNAVAGASSGRLQEEGTFRTTAGSIFLLAFDVAGKALALACRQTQPE
eukprot:729491-Rhodomonas_salina.1